MPFLPRILALSLVVLLSIALECPKAESPQQTSVREKVLERFKLSRECKSLLLPVEVKGKKYGFILDTGAGMTCYDTSLRSFLGDPVLFQAGVMHTPHGEIRTTLFHPPTAKLGHLDLPKNSPVWCMDFEKCRELLKEDIYGALGMDFLKEHVFRVDFVRGEVAFLRSIGSNPGVRIPVTFQYDNSPQIEVSFSGVETREKMLVDTGNVGVDGTLRADLFDVLVKRGFLTLAGEWKFQAALGSGSTKHGRVDEISLGGFQDKKLLFSRSKVNTLGLYYWADYDVVTFDFPNKAIYLRKKRKETDKNERGK